MRRLALLRHAKSSWDDPNLPDRERPLAKRGLHAAPSMGKHSARIGLAPDLVLCSPARRARETWDLVRPRLETGSETRIEPILYGGSDEAILALLRGTPESVKTLLVIGHNPTLQDLAATTIEPEAMPEKFPSGALAVIECALESWADFGPGCGRLVHFATPRMVDNKTV